MFRLLVCLGILLGALVPGRAGLSPSRRRAPQAQTDLAGTWQGLLYQPGGPWSRYRFTLTLHVLGAAVAGFSRIEVPGTDYFGVMAIQGRLTAGGLAFHEAAVVDQQVKQEIGDGAVWVTSFCLKYARNLRYDAREQTLSGTWDGCFPPGTLVLHRIGPGPGPGPGIGSLAPPGASRPGLDTILFAPGQAALSPEAVAALQEVQALSQLDPAARIRILGHADPAEGPGSYALSLRRAQAVAKALEGQGVAKALLSIQGCGSTHPVVAGQAIVGREANRRVEVLFEGVSAAAQGAGEAPPPRPAATAAAGPPEAANLELTP